MGAEWAATESSRRRNRRMHAHTAHLQGLALELEPESLVFGAHARDLGAFVCSTTRTCRLPGCVARALAVVLELD